MIGSLKHADHLGFYFYLNQAVQCSFLEYVKSLLDHTLYFNLCWPHSIGFRYKVIVYIVRQQMNCVASHSR